MTLLPVFQRPILDAADLARWLFSSGRDTVSKAYLMTVEPFFVVSEFLKISESDPDYGTFLAKYWRLHQSEGWPRATK